MRKALFSISLVLPSFLLADQLILDTGEKIRGQLLDYSAGFVTLQLAESSGIAIRRFTPEQIQTLAFNDDETPLEIRAKKRARFITILSEEDSIILLDYLKQLQTLHLHTNALNLTKLWHPQNPYPSLDTQYRQILIESALAAEREAEAIQHARNWLQLSPPPYGIPLPWQVLAQHQLESNRPKEALQTALTPIAHAIPQNQSNFQPLHKIAAQSYQILGYNEHAQAHLSSNPNDLLEISKPLHLTP